VGLKTRTWIFGCTEKGDQIAVAAKIIVIEQQTHADSAIGGLQQMFRENAARLVRNRRCSIGHRSFGLRRESGQGGARHQGFEPIFQNAEPRFAGVALLRRGPAPAQGAVASRLFEGERRRCGCRRVQRGAPRNKGKKESRY